MLITTRDELEPLRARQGPWRNPGFRLGIPLVPIASVGACENTPLDRDVQTDLLRLNGLQMLRQEEVEQHYHWDLIFLGEGQCLGRSIIALLHGPRSHHYL